MAALTRPVLFWCTSQSRRKATNWFRATCRCLMARVTEIETWWIKVWNCISRLCKTCTRSCPRCGTSPVQKDISTSVHSSWAFKAMKIFSLTAFSTRVSVIFLLRLEARQEHRIVSFRVSTLPSALNTRVIHWLNTSSNFEHTDLWTTKRTLIGVANKISWPTSKNTVKKTAIRHSWCWETSTWLSASGTNIGWWLNSTSLTTPSTLGRQAALRSQPGYQTRLARVSRTARTSLRSLTRLDWAMTMLSSYRGLPSRLRQKFKDSSQKLFSFKTNSRAKTSMSLRKEQTSDLKLYWKELFSIKKSNKPFKFLACTYFFNLCQNQLRSFQLKFFVK